MISTDHFPKLTKELGSQWLASCTQYFPTRRCDACISPVMHLLVPTDTLSTNDAFNSLIHLFSPYEATTG